MITLLSAQGVIGQGAAFPFVGGTMGLIVSGTFAGVTVQIQVQSPDGTWVPVDGGDTTAASIKNLSLPPCTVRAAVTSWASGSVNVYLLNI